MHAATPERHVPFDPGSQVVETEAQIAAPHWCGRGQPLLATATDACRARRGLPRATARPGREYADGGARKTAGPGGIDADSIGAVSLAAAHPPSDPTGCRQS